MPGEFDPTNYTLPQQPLHHCMLPLARAYATLRLVTNPYQADVDGVRYKNPVCHQLCDGCWWHGVTARTGVRISASFPPKWCRFLGTSGQNVSDIFKYSSMDDYLEILEWTLLAGHISPTAPDTLGEAGAGWPPRQRGVCPPGGCERGFPS